MYFSTFLRKVSKSDVSKGPIKPKLENLSLYTFQNQIKRLKNSESVTQGFFNVFGLRAPHHKITYCKRNVTLATLQRIQVDSLFLLEVKFSTEVFILHLPMFLALY